jgi:RhtB (resistance to homoserine/threonine) family protein
MGVHLWAFVGISVVVILAPGPDTVMVTKNAILHGRRAAFGTDAGVSTGLLVWTLAAAIGIAALIQASAIAFTAIKLAGAAYLIWLGLQAWRHARTPSGLADGVQGIRAASALAGFRQGVASDLANPKIAVFFTSLLPQFVTSRQTATGALLLLGGVFVALTLVWLIVYAYAAARLARVLVRPSVKAAMDRITAIVLIAFGVRLALEHR